jgi:polyvinyl alcohol dehydrogenase (cytochrome)
MSESFDRSRGPGTACLFIGAWLLLGGDLALSQESRPHPGETLFKASCAACHENPHPRAPFRPYLQFMTPQAIYGTLTEGSMRPNAAHLKNEEKRAIAEYLSGMSLDEIRPPRPQPQCSTAIDPGALAQSNAVRGWSRDYENSRFIPAEVARLAAEDVPRLEVKWAFRFPDARRARSQPSAAGGVLFVGSQNGGVYALDARSGCQHWVYRASGEVRTAITIGQGARPALYFGDLFGNVYAVEATTGAPIWKIKADEHPAATITGSPVVHEDRVYVPLSGQGNNDMDDPRRSCCTNRGAVLALDAKSGAVIWKTYTIPEPAVEQLRTEAGAPQYGPAGASVMTTPTLDVKRKVLYIGTGQNHGVVSDTSSDAIVALALADGKVVWKTQATEGDTWPASPFRDKSRKDVFLDFDFSASPILIHDEGGGDILVAGQKSGEAFGFDPDDGKILWRTRLGRGGASGGVHFSIAHEGRTVFVPMHDNSYSLDIIFPPLTTPAQPGISAVDAYTGEILWRTPMSTHCKSEKCQGISAAITAIPGVVFAPRRDGGFEAYDSRTGKIVWAFDTAREYTAVNGDTAHGGAIAGAGPLVVDGMVYVNSGYGIYGSIPGNVLLAFSVDGK